MAPSRDESSPFVSRAGLKLAHAIDEFGLNVNDLVCADFGCNVGGFTDCLLQHGAARVYAVDTGYGTLAWKLRTNERVVVMERTNALHAHPPEGGVDLVVIDLGWTPQRLAVPAALSWLRPDTSGDGSLPAVITLIKPHYELDPREKREVLREGVLEATDAERILTRTLEAMPGHGAEVVAHTRSPLAGRKSSRRKGDAGNVEYLALLRPTRTAPRPT